MAKKFLTLILLLCCSLPAQYADDSPWNMSLNGQNLIEPGPHTYTFSGNPYHSRHTTSTIRLPFKEQLQLPIGKTISQPVILNNHLYILAGDGIKVISLKEKKVVQSIRLQFFSTSDPFDYDEAGKMKAPSSQLTHVPNASGWWNSDGLDRLLCGTRDGLLYCFRVYPDHLEQEWCFSGGKGTRYRSTPIFFFDRKTKAPYVAIGSLNQNLYIVDHKGQLLKKIKENGEISSSPMTYKDIDGIHVFDRFIVGVDKGYGQNGGYLSSYYALLGQVYPSRLFNQQKSADFKFSGIPASMCSKDIGNDILIFLSDKEGRFYCFSEKSGQLLWQINRYVQPGVLTINNTPAVDDELVYFTLTNFKGKARLIGIDYRQALDLARKIRDPKSTQIEQAVIMEASDYTGITYSGTSIADVLEPGSDGVEASQKILITSNQLDDGIGGHGGPPTLFAYYAQKKQQGHFLAVKDAFLTKSPNGAIKLSSTLSLPGGIVSEPTLTDDRLMVVDGNGVLHVYGSAYENNVAVTNIQPDTEALIRGKPHTVTATIQNYSKKIITTDVFLQVGGTTKTFKEVPLPPDATPVPLSISFTAPVDEKIKTLVARCQVDPEQLLTDESDRSDNFIEKALPLKAPLDITAKVESKTYETSKNVTTTVQISNSSSTDLKDIPLAAFVAGKILSPLQKTHLSAHSTKEIAIKWRTPDVPGAVQFKICADSAPETPNEVVETDEINNKSSAEMTIIRPSCDLLVTQLTPQKVLEGTWIVPRVVVKNNSNNAFTGNRKVKVTLQLGNEMLSTLTDLEAGETRSVPFLWKVPLIHGKSTEVRCTAYINPDRSVPEHALMGDVWANNVLASSLTLVGRSHATEISADPDHYKPGAPPPGCEKNTVPWVESRFDHMESRIVGYTTETYDVERTRADGTSYTVSKTRKTPIYEDFEVFKDWHFHTTLELQAKVNPVALKSGYGFEITCTTDVSTNYDKLEKITGAQRVYAYFPEDGYSTPIPLEAKDDGRKLHNQWTLPINIHSATGKYNHYVPPWFPNGPYVIKLVATDQNSPGGSGCTTRLVTLFVSGNMYEDDYSTSTKD